MIVRSVITCLLLPAFFCLPCGSSAATIPSEDGYDLWLRYRPVADEALREAYRQQATEVVVQGDSLIAGSAREELRRGLSGLLDGAVGISPQVTQAGAVVAGCRDTSPLVEGLGWDDELEALGEEGFLIRSAVVQGKPVTVIAGGGERGMLYGVFRYLSLPQRHQPISELDLSDRPVNQIRLLNHWDNWRPTRQGTIERGYAGGTLWKWAELPERIDRRYRDYARANASIGINGSVINNVNAQTEFIESDHLPKVAALAEVFRAYGIRLYLSVRFDSPMVVGGLTTADPMEPAVAAWWKNKVEEIYRHIPDFGGFLVKGDSEGQPGPLQYGRSHAAGGICWPMRSGRTGGS